MIQQHDVRAGCCWLQLALLLVYWKLSLFGFRGVPPTTDLALLGKAPRTCSRGSFDLQKGLVLAVRGFPSMTDLAVATWQRPQNLLPEARLIYRAASFWLSVGSPP